MFLTGQPNLHAFFVFMCSSLHNDSMSMWSSQCLLSLCWSSCWVYLAAITLSLCSRSPLLVAVVTPFASKTVENITSHHLFPSSVSGCCLWTVAGIPDVSRCRKALPQWCQTRRNLSIPRPSCQCDRLWMSGGVCWLRTRIACRGLQPVGAKCCILD